MLLRTCLLVSEDPDDHIQFTEALNEVSSDLVVLVVTDAAKALSLLSVKRHIPDFIIISLAMSGCNPDHFAAALQKDSYLQGIPLIAYGELSDYSKVQNGQISAFLNNDLSYTRLRNVLVNILTSC